MNIKVLKSFERLSTIARKKEKEKSLKIYE